MIEGFPAESYNSTIMMIGLPVDIYGSTEL